MPKFPDSDVYTCVQDTFAHFLSYRGIELCMSSMGISLDLMRFECVYFGGFSHGTPMSYL